MAKAVIKRDGSKEPFDAQKIRNAIIATAYETDIPEKETNKVVEQVMAAVMQMAGEKEEIATSEIREKVLSELDRLEPAIAEVWRKYDRENKGLE